MKKLLILGLVLASNLNASNDRRKLLADNLPVFSFSVKDFTGATELIYNGFIDPNSSNCSLDPVFRGPKDTIYELGVEISPLTKDEEIAYNKYKNNKNKENFLSYLGGAAFALTCVAAWDNSPTFFGLGLTGLVAFYSNKSCIATENKEIDNYVLREMRPIDCGIQNDFGYLDPIKKFESSPTREIIKKRLIANEKIFIDFKKQFASDLCK